MIDADKLKEVLSAYGQQVVWVPIVGLLIGVLFNIGYFNEFGFGLFGVFSLSEHVVFAFQVLPNALLLMLFAGAVAFATLKAEPRGVWIGMAAMCGGGIVVSSIKSHDPVPIVIYVSFAFLMIFIFAIKIIPATAKILFSIFVVGTCALLLGKEAGRDATIGQMPYSLEYGDTKIAGNLLRAGDKAVLFYNDDKKIFQLIKWTDIKEISRTKD